MNWEETASVVVEKVGLLARERRATKNKLKNKSYSKYAPAMPAGVSVIEADTYHTCGWCFEGVRLLL